MSHVLLEIRTQADHKNEAETQGSSLGSEEEEEDTGVKRQTVSGVIDKTVYIIGL